MPVKKCRKRAKRNKMAANNYRIPPVFSEAKPYSRWIEEVKVWQTVTELKIEQQAAAIALSLPENAIRDKVVNELGVAELNRKEGVEDLLSFMDAVYKKDEISTAYEVFSDFDRYKRSQQTPMEDYLLEFERLYNRTKKYSMSLPQAVLAFGLLDGSGLEHKDRQLVLTGVDYKEEATLFKQMSISIRKFFGKQSMPVSDTSFIKIEPVFLAEDSEQSAYYASRNRWNGRGRSGNRRGRRGSGYVFRGQSGQKNRGGHRRSKNPLGEDGYPLKCLICESVLHFARDCPDSYENMNRQPEEAALFTGNLDNEMQALVCESVNAAVLDSVCTSTVSGSVWMEDYLGALSEEQSQKVITCKSDTVFKFGGGKKLKSIKKVTFPCRLPGQQCSITADVVDSNIPLLLGKPLMKAAKIVLDLENDRANIFGQDVDLACTTSGHYCVPLLDKDPIISAPEVFYSMEDKSEKEKEKVITKLHRQFGHPSSHRLKLLLRDSGCQDKEVVSLIETVSSACDICKKYKKTSPKPVVSLPLTTTFNEVIALDLKQWQPGTYFLHMIDMATRFSLAAVIHDKQPKTIVDKILTLWIGSGFGIPGKILTDNGGEFANEEMRDMAENLNIVVWNTAGFSPWQNGTCERNHAVVDDCVQKMLADNPKLDLEIALVWAINAKNSLQMVHGWSPYQLVFGCNPNIPSVLTDRPPALKGTTVSELFAKHLNSIHSSRKAFIEAESSERIRRALRHQIRSSGIAFETGEEVYYQRNGVWRGPGKVIGQDGKIVFVRHGNVYVRVHPCRLTKVGEEFQKTSESGEHCSVHPTAEDAVFPTVPIEISEDGEQTETEDLGERRIQSNNGLDLPKVKMNIKYLPAGSEDWRVSTIISRGGKANGRNRAWFNVRDENTQEIKSINFDTGVTAWEILDTTANSESVADREVENPTVFISSSCQQSHEVDRAKDVELENWKTFCVYEEIVDCGQPRMSTRWVVTEKRRDDAVLVKARLVVRGFEEKEPIQSDSPTAGKDTLRIVLSLSSTMTWKLNTIDIKAAFLQGKEIDRDIYLQPPVEADSDGKLWKLRKCVYGLNDASRQWYFSVRSELLKSGCVQSVIDPALFYWHSGDQLSGFFLMHVDDFIWSGTEEFEKTVIENIRSSFKVGREGEMIFKYIGMEIKQLRRGIVLDQWSYIESMEPIPMSASRSSQKDDELNQCEITQLRSLIGQLSWVGNQTRPDICFDVLELSTSIKHPKVSDILKANKTVKRLKCENVPLYFPKFDCVSNMRVVLFCDASYANLSDGVSSASGFVIFLVGDGLVSSPLAWRSNKIHRVVRSTLAAETLSMVDGLDTTCYLGHLLSELLFKKNTNVIPIDCLTDNKSLFENIHSTKLVSEKRLRVDIASIKQMLQQGVISNVQWVDSIHQLSDCLTKKGASSDQLLGCLKSGCLSHT